MRKIKFDTLKYDFRKKISEIFNANLEELHKEFEFEKKIFTMQNNSDTKFHRIFYDKINSGWNDFDDLYENFIKDVVRSNVDEKLFIFQKNPTLRIHFANNWATPEFHCDSQPGYNHPKGEINFILPLTKCINTNAVWAESEPGKSDYKSMDAIYGELIQFDGNILKHGNKINKENQTRVSFDFRILPKSKYTPDKYEFTSGTKKLKFQIGSYYKEIE
jgi:hypothetical protein